VLHGRHHLVHCLDQTVKCFVPDALRTKIASQLEVDGFQVQSSVPSAHGTVIQAKKGGFLSGLIAADRAFTVLVDGTPADFTVRLGVGKWLEHLGVTAVETLFLSVLFLPVDVAETLWNLEVENKIAKEIDALVEATKIS
jgi:hypothetical protein